MKILYVITSLYTGGAERLMVDILPRLKDRGQDVELLLFNGSITPFYRELENRGIKIHSFGTGSVYNPLFVARMIPLMKRFDIVHTHNSSPQYFAAIANFFCKKRIVYTEHNTSSRRRNMPLLKPLDRWCYQCYDRIICISGKAEDNLRTYLGSKSRAIVCTINNGIDVTRFANASTSNWYTAVKSDNFIITMVAGFREQKDQDTLIRAMRFLPEDCKLWLVGDGERRGILERLCIEVGVSGRVKIWGVRTDVPEVLKTSDVVVMSSHYEGLSLSSVEGMAAGKPTITSDVDGLKQVVDGYGLLFPHQDDRALANVIIKLHDNADFYESVAVSCKNRSKDFDIERMVDEYNNVYHTM